MEESKKVDNLSTPKECELPAHSLGGYLLDSSLIIATNNNKSLYSTKVVECGEYIQIYDLEKKHITPKIKENDNFDLSLIKAENIKLCNNNQFKEIRLDNIIRSKLECQRLAKANSKCWETFITLTFADNITDLNYANKKYKMFISKIKRIFKNFICLAIPEFQKRGAVHYHLLTNIDINNNSLIFKQLDNHKFYHIKYWHEGFTQIEIVKGNIKKIIGYISKYMTKDIDNRLYGHHRYFFTRNLKRPTISYLDLDNLKHKNFLNQLLFNKSNIYSNEYINPYNKEKIAFSEFLTNS